MTNPNVISDAPSLRMVRELRKEKTFELLTESAAVLITDPDGLIVYANRRFVDICGYSLPELYARSHQRLGSGRQNPSSFDEMRKSLDEGRVWKGELFGQTQSGESYWTDTQGIPIKNDDGKIVAFLSVHYDITDAKKLKLEAEREKYKISAIYNNTPDSNMLISPEGEILFFNRSARRMFKRHQGMELAEGKSIYDFLIPENEKEFDQHFGRALSGEEVKTEFQFTLRGNQKRWFLLSYTPVYDDHENLIGISRNCTDIEKGKNTEEDLVREKRQLRALIETIPDAIFFKDGAGKWLITNDAAKKLFRLNEIDWLNKGEMELAELHPEFRTAHEMCLIDDEKAWSARRLMVFTEYVQDEHGQTREYEVRKMPVFGVDGSRKALVIIGTDITDRKRNEIELKRAKKMLEQTARLAKIGGWEADFDQGTLTWSRLTREMAEVPEDYVPSLETVATFYKEGDSRQKMLAAVERARQEGIGFEIEVEMISAKGKPIHTKSFAEPKMVNGKCVKLYGYFQNITEQVELNQKNEQIERKFSHLIEKSADAMVLQDAEGNIIYFSPAAERMLGYSPAEMMGKNMASLFHPDDVAEGLERRNQIRQAVGESSSIVVNRIRHKKGYYVYIEGTVTNLLHDANVQAVVANFRDVTEKRATEEKLRTKNDRLEQIAYLFSHEVRGPVATIMGLASIFNTAKKDDPLNHEVIEKILVPVNRLDDIIRKIVQKTHELELDLPSFFDQKDPGRPPLRD